MDKPIVLVVDDEPSIRRLVQRMLRRPGWDVHEADNALRAMAMLGAQHYRVALLDISMPGISGTALCHAIRERPELRHLRLIACTAHAFAQDREKFLAAGFDEVLTKPFLMEELYEAIGIDGNAEVAA